MKKTEIINNIETIKNKISKDNFEIINKNKISYEVEKIDGFGIIAYNDTQVIFFDSDKKNITVAINDRISIEKDTYKITGKTILKFNGLTKKQHDNIVSEILKMLEINV